MHAVDPGFEPDGLLLASMNLPATSYRGTAAHVAFYDAVLERIRALPGVTGAAGTSEPPIVGFRMTRDIVVEGHSFAPDERPDVEYRAVTADFFRTLRIPTRAGRPLTATDDANGAPVIMVNEAFARRFWPAGEAVGRRVRLDDLWHEIVGVAGDVRQAGLDAAEQPVIYAPYAQKDWTWLSWMSLVVRTTGDPLALAAPLRRAVWEVDPLLPIHEIAAIETLYHADAADRRFAMVLMAAFAVAGLALGAVGTYGVVAFAVAGRTREIGVRVALGAGRGRILALVVGEGLRFAAAGLAVGLFGAFVAARLLGGLLFGVRPDDPLTFACVAVLTAAVAIAATLPAAARAARIDAGRTLRGG
jgi:putative ABC transport system permease protein